MILDKSSYQCSFTKETNRQKFRLSFKNQTVSYIATETVNYYNSLSLNIHHKEPYSWTFKHFLSSYCWAPFSSYLSR